MAYTTGTAASYQALFDALITFLTTDATLVAAGKNWELLRRNSYVADAKMDCADLRGPGLAGGDNIYVQLILYKDAANDTYSIRVSGSSAWLSSVTPPNYANQPNATAALITPKAPLWNNATPYWFVANGRRFIVVAKVGSYWSSLYAGLILPYGTPSQYPYPLFVGGNSAFGEKYSDTQALVANSSFWLGYGNSSAMHLPDGTVKAWSGGFYNGAAPYNYSEGKVWPWFRGMGTNGGITGIYGIGFIQPHPDGTYPLIPSSLYFTGGQIYGEFDGVLFTCGFGAAAGDTITAGGKTYLMVQRGASNGAADFAAIILE